MSAAMGLALTPYQQGLLTPLAAVGTVVVVGALLWLASVMLPEITWWTIKRLPLGSEYSRDRAAAVVAASRRAHVLRIPYGVRVILSLGGDRADQAEVLARLSQVREEGSELP